MYGFSFERRCTSFLLSQQEVTRHMGETKLILEIQFNPLPDFSTILK